MKKMIVMLAVVTMVAAANAGTVLWTSSGLQTALPGGAFSGTALSGAIAYLYQGTPDGAAIKAAIDGDTFTGAGNLSSATTSSLGVIGKAGIGSFVSQNVTLYMVIFDAATIGGANYYMISSAITQSFGASGNKTYTFTTAGGTLPTSWTAVVPEPTSMALLALGVAAIGLRRKIRK